jgi:hypothetical protein
MSSSPQLSGDFCGLAVQMLESPGLSSAQVNILNATAFELSKIPGVIAVAASFFRPAPGITGDADANTARPQIRHAADSDAMEGDRRPR